jgi:hypothetical protein
VQGGTATPANPSDSEIYQFTTRAFILNLVSNPTRESLRHEEQDNYHDNCLDHKSYFLPYGMKAEEFSDGIKDKYTCHWSI